LTIECAVERYADPPIDRLSGECRINLPANNIDLATRLSGTSSRSAFAAFTLSTNSNLVDYWTD